jgi:hypothetical protein
MLPLRNSVTFSRRSMLRMTLNIDLTKEQLNNFKVIIDVMYDLYITSKPGAQFKEVLDIVNREVDRELTTGDGEPIADTTLKFKNKKDKK